MVGARLAATADAAAVAALARLAAEGAAAQRGGEHAADDPILHAPTDLTIVGTIGEAVVGFTCIALPEGSEVAP